MKLAAKDYYVCPLSHEPLSLESAELTEQGDVTGGSLATASGRAAYPVRNGMPDFSLKHPDLPEDIRQNKLFYEKAAKEYDAGMDWLFQSFSVDENHLRKKMIDLLELQPGACVLEIGAGTCRDSREILQRLDASGKFFINDLSVNMLAVGRNRLQLDTSGHVKSPLVEFFTGDAASLPFPDNFFDAAYHFGGLNLFADKSGALQELSRVVKAGGKVVIGDEGVPPWLQNTTFGKILTSSNSLYRYQAPLECLPPNSQEVCVRWVLGEAFYVIDYRVSEGLPFLNLDLPIPGKRGGTHRTRYYGALEGINPETKEKMEQAAAKEGVSLHEWLERTIKKVLP
jgi:ubiquinone/menaquinone biosynthesis C-methylase UbiE